MNTATLSSQSTLSPAEIASSANTPDAWGHYPAPLVSHLRASNGVELLVDALDQWLYLVPSQSHPGTVHLVSLRWGSQRGYCECKGYTFRGACHHLALAYAAWQELSVALHDVRRYMSPNAVFADYAQGGALLARLTVAAPASANAITSRPTTANSEVAA